MLYGTVPEFVAPERQSRAFGLFYTLGIGAGAAAPFLSGLVSDWVGLPAALTLLGGLAIAIIPLSLFLAPALSRSASHN